MQGDLEELIYQKGSVIPLAAMCNNVRPSPAERISMTKCLHVEHSAYCYW